MRAWRICKQKFSAAAFSGEGARLFAGRWNPVGIRMVYCSTSLALAAMEFFVHLDPSLAPDDLVSAAAEIPDTHHKIERLEIATLPPDWHATENLALRQIGANWIASQRSVALLVPSAVIDGEWNLLLNPTHPDFPKIQIEEPHPFHFDARMFTR